MKKSGKMTRTPLLSLLYKKKQKKMNTSITITEFLIISVLTVVVYAVVKAAYETWIK